MGRIICLDIGEKRIGIAASDPLLITAQGIETYARKTEEEDIAYLAQKIKQLEGFKLIVGLPVNMNGTQGPQAQKVMDFTGRLEEKTGMKAQYFDERLTTRAAERILIDADVSRAKRRKIIDKMAAVQILQSYLGTI